VERAEREHLLLEVLEDDAVHPRAELGRAFAVFRVVGEAAPGGLELPRVEDELAGGPRAARLGARGRVGLGVGEICGPLGLDREFGLRRLERQVARPDEPGELRPGGAGLSAGPAAVTPEVGGMLAEVGLEGFRAAEVDDVAQPGVAGDLPAAPAGALAREGVPGDRAEAGASDWVVGSVGAGRSAAGFWMLGCIARSSRREERARQRS
jgi:hypothetical protein